jgi:hypothetical protein
MSESFKSGPGLECPACHARLLWTEVSVDTPFKCPHCDKEVAVPAWFHRGLTWSAMAIAGVMAYQFGLRDLVFLLFIGIAFIPVGVVLSIVIRRFWLVRLRLTESVSLNLTRTYPDGQSHR